ncbi:DUF4880 domain-containing protein [Duganella sp. FT27W]|nr:DUF4880 domain-containing protein [Duganella sp. FT27W]
MELHDGPLSPERRAQLAQWRQRSDEHALAWQRATALLGKFQALPPGGAAALTKLSARPDRRRTVKVVAALLVAAPAGWLAWRAGPWQPAGIERTTVGERRQLVLADGTRLHLNTDTEIVVASMAGERCVQLRRGDILVATAQPFLVEVAQGVLRALDTFGTRFMVRQLGDECRLAVQQGTVDIRLRATAASSAIRAGMQTGFTTRSIAAPVALDANAAAWQNGMLVADRQPLPDFLRELGRYRSGTLQCDPALAHLAVSGAFPVDDTDFTLTLLAQTLPVRIQHLTRYWVRVLPSEVQAKK